MAEGQRRWQESLSPGAHPAGSGHNNHHLSASHPHPALSPCPPLPLAFLGCQSGRTTHQGNGWVLSRQGQQTPRHLISSLPRPGEEQTAADESPKGAAQDGSPSGSHSTWDGDGPTSSPGCGDGSPAEAISGGFRGEAAFTLGFEECVGFRSLRARQAGNRA